jgi:hypothetical protein
MGHVVSNAFDDLRGAQMVPARYERGDNGSVRFENEVLLVVQQVVHESCPRPDDEMHHDVGQQMGPRLCDVGQVSIHTALNESHSAMVSTTRMT